ncbi:MAG: EamA/RhaT family transporter [Alphaproteobacteria bacterium]|nr:EamA/RhaT family transporter [Alphaproteobacteria bacterium]
MFPLWPILALSASGLQVVRNAAQRRLTETLGIWGASYVRFVYGAPFAALWLAGILAWRGVSGGPGWTFAGWVLIGSTMQGVAMVLLVIAMRGRGFAVANALSKTEALGATALSALLVRDPVGPLQWIGAIIATAGIALLTRLSLTRAALWSALAGAGSGACFSLSSVAYRASTVAWGGDPWVAAAATLNATLATQTVLGGVLLAVFQPKVLAGAARAWRPSLVPGASGAFASALLFTAFAFAPSAGAVKTVQLADVLISWLVSRRIFREGLTPLELAGGALILGGAVLVLAQ